MRDEPRDEMYNCEVQVITWWSASVECRCGISYGALTIARMLFPIQSSISYHINLDWQ